MAQVADGFLLLAQGGYLLKEDKDGRLILDTLNVSDTVGLTLDDRDVNLGLEDRSTGLALMIRDVNLGLEDREANITLKTRSTGLTLKDR